jgi:hypothetical protein
MRAQALTWEEDCQLERLVLRSITSRYQGELERCECSVTAEVTYTPVDTGDVHDLMITLWGEYLTRDRLELMEAVLCEGGADRGPAGLLRRGGRRKGGGRGAGARSQR